MHYSFNFCFGGIVATGERYTMHNTHSTEHSVPFLQNIEHATQKVNTLRQVNLPVCLCVHECVLVPMGLSYKPNQLIYFRLTK